MRKFFALLIFMFILVNENPGFAHGVGSREISVKTVSLEFFYSTGDKMSYCDVKIFSPSASKFAVQSGRTDEQGRFAFIPDTLGEWLIIVNDGQGHQCETKINITEEFLRNENSTKQNHEDNTPEGLELFIRALLGVSLIFNAALLIRSKNHAH